MVSLRSPAAVGSALRAIRLSKGLTQAEAAEAAGVSRKWVCDAERGKPSMDVGLVIALLKSMDYWFEFHPRPGHLQGVRLYPSGTHSRYQVGVLMREIRRYLGMTQLEAAGAAGVSRSWLCSIEGDNRKHSVEMHLVLRLLAVFGYEVQFHPKPQSVFDLDAHLENYRRGRFEP